MHRNINRRAALVGTLGIGGFFAPQLSAGDEGGVDRNAAAQRGSGSSHPEPRASDRLPDVALINHRGETVRFYSDLIVDRPVVINMMFVNCKGTCSGTSARLSSLWPELEAAIGPELRLLSITLDPHADTPEALEEYASAYRPRKAALFKSDWQFLTGNPADIEEVRKGLGLTDLDPKVDQDITQHASLLTFGNDRLDRWASLPVESSERQMLKAMIRILRGSQVAGAQS